MKYLIAVHVTVNAENKEEAYKFLRNSLATMEAEKYFSEMTGDEIEDYSIEDTLESYEPDGTINLFGDK